MTGAGPAHVDLDRPEHRQPAFLAVLTHGAGSNARAPLLVALAETLASAGFAVLRCDLPYRQVELVGDDHRLERRGDADRDVGIRPRVAGRRDRS